MPVDLKLLEETPTFRSLEPQKRDKLAGLLKYVHFDAGEPICERGHHGETMYFIEKGDEKDANIRNDTIMEKVQITPLEIKHLREQVTALAERIHADRHNPQQPPKGDPR